MNEIVFPVTLLILSLVSTVMYFLPEKAGTRPKELARMIYFTIAAGTVLMSGYFLYLIVSHDYTYSYVYLYSNSSLSGLLLFSSFYAGQEGSFMLWTLFIVLTGLTVLPSARKNNYEPVVMGLYSLMLSFLFILLIAKNPFERIFDTFAGENLPQGFIPPDGRGLNPILENFWMAIHPPILFAGYALLTVPFTFATAGFIRKDFHSWIKIANPWTLFSTAIFGLGIALGSFWAYEALSFGGFWAWDPVENSSFLPWLTAVALIHTMKVQKARSGLIKTNYILATLTFVLVLLATFLTRSGVLSDTSVHSFNYAGDTVYYLLLLFMLSFTLIPLIILFLRIKSIPSVKSEFNTGSREFAMSLGTMLILALAAVILIGTTAPLLPGFLFGSFQAATPEFYNSWTLPLVMAMMALDGVAVHQSWKTTEWKQFLKKTSVLIILSLLITISVVIAAGINELRLGILAFTAVFSLIFNGRLFIKKIAVKPKALGAYTSHAGIAFLLTGILSLTVFSEKTVATLAINEPAALSGYTLTWTSKLQTDSGKKDRKRYEYHIAAVKNGSSQTLKPVFMYSSFNDYQAAYTEPGISNSLIEDLFITPLALDYKINMPSITATKGVDYDMPTDSSVRFKLLKLKMPHNEETGANSFLLGAVVQITSRDTTVIDTFYTIFEPDTKSFTPQWKMLPIDGGWKTGLYNLVWDTENMANTKAEFAFSREEKPKVNTIEKLTVEFETKPLMSFVWIGFALIIAGFLLPIGKPSGY